jgi:hypothetical protein
VDETKSVINFRAIFRGQLAIDFVYLIWPLLIV